MYICSSIRHISTVCICKNASDSSQGCVLAYRITPYAKGLFGEGYHVGHVAQHVPSHMQPLPIGTRNYFGSASPYHPPSYPRYDA